MSKIAITTDTNSGMIPHQNEAQGIFVLPMPFIIDGVCQLESVELSRDDFYEKLVGGSSVSTSQPSVGDVHEFWEEILKEYDEIVHIPTSTYLSNSCETAKAHAKEFDGRVHVVDNHRISIALKSSVFDAAYLRDEGKSAAEILEILEAHSAEYSVYFSLETMEYLKKGGRISPAAATIGSILKLRPVLHLQGETLGKFALPRSVAKAKTAIVDAIKAELNGQFKEYFDNGEMRLAVVYAENKDEAVAFAEEMQKLFPNVPMLYNDPMSLSIACHTGPTTLGLACIRVLHK